MVKKELNAAFIEQLRDNNIQILPYVSDKSLRSKLRPDIASLQCREWNSKNFSEILPSVIAEIWRSNFEKKIKDAVLREKGIRLELEHKIAALEESSDGKIFSKSENTEFEFIQKSINGKISIPATLKTDSGVDKKILIEINTFVYLAKIPDDGYNIFDAHHITADIHHYVNNQLKPQNAKSVSFDGRRQVFELQKLVIKFGLTDSHLIQGPNRSEFVNQITPKYRRFIYWLEFNKKLVGESVQLKE